MEKKLLPGYGRIMIRALAILLFAFNYTFAQIALRGPATTANSNNATLTINRPAGVIAGDLMIVNIAQRGTNTLSNPTSAGWTLISGVDLGGGTFRWGALLYKIAGAAEPANYSFTLDGQNNGGTGAVVAFSGVDPVTPFDVPSGAISVQGSQIGITAPSKTTVTNNAAVIMFAMAAGSSPTYSGWTTTSPGALVELYDNQNVGASSVGAAWATKAAAGATGAGAAVLNTAERNGGILLALRPIAPPTITGISGSPTCPGGTVTITGTNLNGATAANVKIGGTPVSSITSNTGTVLTAVVGAGTTGFVTVTTGGGTATSSPATFTVSASPTVPANPSAPVISAVTSAGLNISFTAAAPASSGYIIIRSLSATAPTLTDGTVYTSNATYTVVYSGPLTGATDSGLVSNTQYYYYIFSQNTGCAGQPSYSSGISTSQVTCAAAPTGPSVSAITGNSATVSWNASVAGGGEAVINYFLEVYTTPAYTGPIAGSPFNNGTALSTALSGLTPGTTYYYRIRATNGCFSTYATGSFITGCATPANPSAPVFSAVTSNSLTLSFTGAAPAPSGYTIIRSLSPTAPTLTDGTVYTSNATYTVVYSGPLTSFADSGLVSNTQYYYYVFSQNTGCTGQPFYSSGISTGQVTCAATPTGASVSAITSNSATVSWTAVPGGNEAAINYIIDVSLNAGFAPVIAGSPFNNGTAVSLALTGLAPGTTYYYRIRATNGCFNAAYLSGNFTTGCATPSNPSAPVFSAVTSTGLTLSFTAAAPVPSGGYIIIRSLSAVPPVLTNGTPFTTNATYTVVNSGPATTVNQAGLNSNTQYYYYIFSQNTGCTGQPYYSSGISDSQITCAATPTNAVNSAITGNSATVSWTAVPGGNAAAINYIIDVSLNNIFTAPIPGSPFNNGTAVSLALTGLNPATTYYYRVRATNGCFIAAYLSGNFTTGCATPAAPSAPVISAVTSTGLTLSFTAAVPAPSGYTVIRSLSAVPPTLTNGTTFVSNATYTVVSTTAATSIVQGGLASNTQYYYYIFSQNTGCTGQPFYSTGISAGQITCAAGTAATTVTGTNLTDATIQWNAASVGGGAGTIGYILEVADNAGFAPQLAGSPFTTGFTVAGGTVSYSFTGLPTEKTYYYRITTTNGTCNSSPVNGSFYLGYCIPSVGNGFENDNYIQRVAFLGTLNDVTNNSTYSTNPRGYQDFTKLANKSVQAQGAGINVYVGSPVSAYYKVWVDWNRNGVFEDATEMVYTAGGVAQSATTFGFVVPANAALGDYRMRIRINSGSDVFSSCGNINSGGETEDYLFTVIQSCPAVITSVTDGSSCGEGTVTLQAKGAAGVTQYKWYDARTGGNLLATTADSGGTGSWTTPSLTSTTVYYVTADNGTCESLERIAVNAVIKAVPTISFTPSSAETCGNDAVIAINAKGDDEVTYLIDEHFEAGNLGVFTNNNIFNTPVNNGTMWQNRTSVYVRPATPYVWKPAISSGINGNKFVMATSEMGQFYAVENALVSPVINTTSYLNLTLTFRMYYSRYYVDNTSQNLDFVNVEISTNGGATWNTAAPIARLLVDVGIGTQFAQRSYDLSAYRNQANLRFRIRYHGEWCDGVAVDDIQLFGQKPLSPSFSWTSTNPINFYSDAATTVPYVAGTPASVVYIKPTTVQLETYPDWNVTATATLSNLCFASGNVVITNNNKVWSSLATDWSTPNWKPGTAAPTSSQCVVIKTPVNVLASTNALAKTLKVEPGGSLAISPNASLKIEDFFMNNATVNDVVVQSGGSLVQVADVPTLANVGSITAERSVNLTAGRQQYNYMMSPVEDQNLKTIYPGIDYVLYHNEANNKFYASSGVYIKGRGLAVKEANSTVSGTSVTGIFKGKPVNGAFSYGIVNSNTGDTNRGFNLTGNPYPSTIDLVALYGLNNSVPGSFSSTFYFWDSKANSVAVQQGDAYGGQAYAMFNAVSGTGVAATGDVGFAGTKIPTRFVKPGQGFMVKTNVAAMNLNFNNSIRSANTGTTDYFGKAADGTKEAAANRYWLNMKSPAGITADLAVVYFEGGHNGFATDDSRSMLGSDVVYTMVENEKLAINGRSSFAITDRIPVGSTHFEAGNYTISLADKEGIFANGQQVYLKDSQAGVIANLSEGAYTFAAVAGESTGRFEIIYRPETIMATDGSVKEELQVYRDGQDFVVKAQRESITELEVYDTAGRLLYKVQPHSTKAVIDANLMTNGVYVLKINQNGRITAKKILR